MVLPSLVRGWGGTSPGSLRATVASTEFALGVNPSDIKQAVDWATAEVMFSTHISFLPS